MDAFMMPAFTISNFDKIQMILKVITGTTSHASRWERTIWRWLFDTDLATLERSVLEKVLTVVSKDAVCHLAKRSIEALYL